MKFLSALDIIVNGIILNKRKKYVILKKILNHDVGRMAWVKSINFVKRSNILTLCQKP